MRVERSVVEMERKTLEVGKLRKEMKFEIRREWNWKRIDRRHGSKERNRK